MVKKMKKILTLAAITLLLTACTATVPKTDDANPTSEQTGEVVNPETADTLPVVEEAPVGTGEEVIEPAIPTEETNSLESPTGEVTP
ncbi:MAG: hypothetical protein A2445_04050 [Candidatus Jacksonbacteria bacterium RIFOXYC2_FULL_44_29]|nr:MAG: hypothetical protein UV19_C0001G0045 [Parcubacteria group bacterium GW2011_GWA2_42_28]KKT56240.1 MAG: hypothetical protein UW45_C0001G0044 [Parcubacteria group bacterium GW2011_GWC2_44_22]OGY76112.1 MAG: hypothetical protein A2240_00270 [Candidatus Jacksonbacteria bacterium RIFOXYA2_FULL_43_12]OGY77703.1 MAG: hypothetical protein A2295_02770 [Candidatus Jacksonbacteria bacterium RIFOXYB2_FULL_44_15]OGY78839.1 MAG: hypothetical protein A2550_04835 [Candidatus Jacksonbacteria bacterium RI